jgi:signal transduction histidine kinase
VRAGAGADPLQLEPHGPHGETARLRALMADALLVGERERRQLATDLHDGLSQTIALVKMRLAALRMCVDERLHSSLDGIADLMEEADQSSRAISFELSPLLLHDLGLVPAVEGLVENIQTRYGLPIRMEDDGQAKVASEETRVIVFRAIRELLINAAKHAHANHVIVRMCCAGECLSVVVEDDGAGFPSANSDTAGFGLHRLKECIHLIGGGLRIESCPGRGTAIRLWAPLLGARLNRAGEPK